MTTDHSNTVGILTDKLGKTTCTDCGVELDISDYDLFERILCPSCEAEQVVPAKLGNFLLLDQLGAGGMGAVYLAQDQRLRRRVALKVMRAEYGQNSKFNADFQTEAQATARLNHANIVQIYSLGEESGQPYIVMELLDGNRMDDMMDNNTQLDEALVLQIAHDVTCGLTAAAEAGIIHGDIKPANILMDTKGTAKVVDFGLARFAENAAEASGEIWGTPFYIAPEKARKKTEDFRADQYSLGATLWHALAGEPPFDGETPTDVVVARFKNPVPDIREFNSSVSEKTAHVLMRMMSKDPQRRFPTYNSLLADLEVARKELTASGSNESTSGGKNNSALWLGIGAVVLIAIGAIAFGVIKAKGKKAVQQQEEDMYTVIRGGRPVRVSRSDLSKQDRANMNMVELPEEPSLTSRGSLVSFSSTKESWLRNAAVAYAEGDLLKSEMQLAKILRTAPPTKAAHHYALLYQAVNYILDDDFSLAKEMLETVRDAKLGLPEGSETKELPMPLASYLLGETSDADLKARFDASADWYKELGGFIQGVHLLTQKKIAPAEKLIKAYASSPGATPVWAYAWQPVAKQVMKELEIVKGLQRDPRGPRAALRDTYPIWSEILGAVKSQPAPPVQAPKAVVQPTPAPKPTPTPQPKAITTEVTADYSLLKREFIALKSLVFSGKYSDASSKVAALGTQMKTSEGRALLQEIRRGIGFQEQMILWLGQQVKALPYAGSELKSGKPVMVAPQGMGLLSKEGQRVKISYEKLDGLDFLKICSWYLNNGKTEQGKAGEHMLGLALYSIHYGGINYAKDLVTSAGSRDPQITKKHANLYYLLTHPAL